MYRVNRFYILIILLRCDERNSTLKTFERIKFHQLSQLFLLASNTRHLPADNGQGTAHPCTACTCPSNSPFSQSSPRTAPPASRSAPSCSHTRAGTLLPLSGRTFPVKIESLNILKNKRGNSTRAKVAYGSEFVTSGAPRCVFIRSPWPEHCLYRTQLSRSEPHDNLTSCTLESTT